MTLKRIDGKTPPATPLQLAAMHAIRGHEQSTGNGIKTRELRNALGRPAKSVIDNLRMKGWVEHEGDYRWYLTDEGIDALESHPGFENPRGDGAIPKLYSWSNYLDPLPLTILQVKVLVAISNHWEDHQRGPTKRDIERVLRRANNGLRDVFKSLEKRGLIVRTKHKVITREIWRFALTDEGREEIGCVRKEAAE